MLIQDVVDRPIQNLMGSSEIRDINKAIVFNVSGESGNNAQAPLCFSLVQDLLIIGILLALTFKIVDAEEQV